MILSLVYPIILGLDRMVAPGIAQTPSSEAAQLQHSNEFTEKQDSTIVLRRFSEVTHLRLSEVTHSHENREA